MASGSTHAVLASHMESSEDAMRIILHHKPLEIRLSPSANKALAARSDVLLAEMELVFACMVRKPITFLEMDRRESADKSIIYVNSGLSVHFVALVSRAACTTVASGSTSTREPLDDLRPYVPRWLAIDYRNGQWLGDFGYDQAGMMVA